MTDHEADRAKWKHQIVKWRSIQHAELVSKNPKEILRIQLLCGKAEDAYHTLMEMIDNNHEEFDDKAYFSLSSKDSCDFHFGHYLVMCNSFLLFEKFKHLGAFAWSSTKLPIHLAMTLPDRHHWIRVLAPLTGEKLQCFGINGWNLAEWAVVYHCSLAPIIQANLWPSKHNLELLYRLAEHEKNEKAATILKILCEAQD